MHGLFCNCSDCINTDMMAYLGQTQADYSWDETYEFIDSIKTLGE